MAIQSGLAAPVKKPLTAQGKDHMREDGNMTSQKLLLTWLIEDESLFEQIGRYIQPGDFTTELYHTVAELLYEQHDAGEVNPARIMIILQMRKNIGKWRLYSTQKFGNLLRKKSRKKL